VNPANRVKTLLWATTLLLVFSLDVVAQNGVHTAEALSNWIALDAPPGWEHVATDQIMRAMPGWKRDVLGNLVLRKGSGSPRRVVACGLDRPGFAVTEITDDGICDCVRPALDDSIRSGCSFTKASGSEF